MAASSYNVSPLMKKVIGLAAIVLGFLLTATGYRYGSPEFTTVGIAMLALGLVLLVLMIVRRNQ
ncbi:hypothetical protein [Phyllobacterium bourgognense]|uniref:LPXTG-motif cell wall-anchored protein n=1 Tax=Phyllobacterium bourgognense TaxID=314236 RepID=A0A368YQB0_9HYPH|nr:hypothetical protein [Phyllobacterium bourgognense]RCW82395.1 hypothetical protein C7476_108210 [Phyllobacterium bourgognense]